MEGRTLEDVDIIYNDSAPLRMEVRLVFVSTLVFTVTTSVVIFRLPDVAWCTTSVGGELVMTSILLSSSFPKGFT